MWSQTEFSKSRTCIKYLVTKVGLPVTKEDVCRHIPCFTLYQGTPGPLVRYLHKSIKSITNFDAHTIPIQ